MRYILFYSITLLIQLNYLNAQDNYASVGSRWVYQKWDLFCNEVFVEVKSDRDTIIQDKLCSIVQLYENSSLVENSEIIFYSKNGLVYFFEENSFKLLYNFSPEVSEGDTITYYLPLNANLYDISSSNGDFLITNPYKLVIEEINNIASNDNQLLNSYSVKLVSNDLSEESCIEFNTIVQNVGSMEGFLGKGCAQLPSGCLEKFICFSSNTFDLVESPLCETSNNSLIDKNEIFIFPNPTNGLLKIKNIDEIDEFFITDVNGKLFKIPFKEQLNLDFLPTGLYFLNIKKQSSNYLLKFIKH